MEEIERLIQECEKRMEGTAELIIGNIEDKSCSVELSKLLEGAKELDLVKAKAQQEHSALEICKDNLSKTEEPWSFNVKELFKREMENHVDKGKEKKNGFHEKLQNFISRQQDKDDLMEVENLASQGIDPWTRQPIQLPMQSSTCKHLYDKKSINCIIKNRSHFKCPYIGCQNVITKDLLVDLSKEN